MAAGLSNGVGSAAAFPSPASPDSRDPECCKHVITVSSGLFGDTGFGMSFVGPGGGRSNPGATVKLPWQDFLAMDPTEAVRDLLAVVEARLSEAKVWTGEARDVFCLYFNDLPGSSPEFHKGTPAP